MAFVCHAGCCVVPQFPTQLQTAWSVTVPVQVPGRGLGVVAKTDIPPGRMLAHIARKAYLTATAARAAVDNSVTATVRFLPLCCPLLLPAAATTSVFVCTVHDEEWH